MKAVIYARYSSDNQREESIDGQLRECMEYAKFNGIDVVNSYIDRALSAKTDNRPNFQRMIKDSYKGLFDVVLVWKLDRFARCFRYGESFEICRLQNVLHASPALPKFVTFFKNRAAMTSAQGLRAPHVSRRNALRGVSDGGRRLLEGPFPYPAVFRFYRFPRKDLPLQKTVR